MAKNISTKIKNISKMFNNVKYLQYIENYKQRKS